MADTSKNPFAVAATVATFTDFGGRPSLTTKIETEDGGSGMFGSPRVRKIAKVENEVQNSSWLHLPCEVELNALEVTECRHMNLD